MAYGNIYGKFLKRCTKPETAIEGAKELAKMLYCCMHPTICSTHLAKKKAPFGAFFNVHRLNDYLVTTTFLVMLWPSLVINLTR